MAFNYSSLQSEYQGYWDTMKINPAVLPDVDRIAKAIAQNRARYEIASKPTGVPWYAIGVIHNMEASLSFSGHLHNGNSLKNRTYDVPAGRPKIGSPPFKWEDSAIDALNQKIIEEKKWSNPPGWSVPEMCYKLELYNGTGYRKFNIPSPYLWAGCQHYTRGKYIADGVWSASAVSSQRGAMVILKRMNELSLLTGSAIPAAGPVSVGGDYGTGCIDCGDAGSRTLSMHNPQSQMEALQILLGLDARARSQQYEFRARLNLSSIVEILDLDIQKTFQVTGIDTNLDGIFTCEDLIFTLHNDWEVEAIANRGDGNIPASSVFLHNTDAGLTPSAPALPGSPVAGSINERILKAAQDSLGQSSRSGPGGGNVACAWCINTLVLPKAGIKPIGSVSVDGVLQEMKAGRGQLITPLSAAKAGDIVIMGSGSHAHIGVCMVDGGSSVLSNSSSKASFSWKDSINNYDRRYKSAGGCQVYRVSS